MNNQYKKKFVKVKGIGSSTFIFFTEKSIGFYINASSTNYKQVFI